MIIFFFKIWFGGFNMHAEFYYHIIKLKKFQKIKLSIRTHHFIRRFCVLTQVNPSK